VLRRLEVERLAILDGLALEFGPGLNVLSGETGAGKSLLLDGLQLALGGRADPALIRQGERALRVAALFELQADSAAALRLEPLGIAPDDGCVLLAREVAREGRSTCRINGQLVSAAVLREAGAALVTLAGQGEHHRFALSSAQLDYLDGAPGAQSPRQRVAQAHAAWQRAVEARDGLGGDARERERRRDMLEFAVREIDGLGLAPDEDARLAARRQVLANAERLLGAARAGLEGLWEGEGAVRDRLGAVAGELAAAVRLDPGLAEVAALLEQAAAAVDEAARGLRRYAEAVPHDPAELAAVEGRWGQLQRLRRKYGETAAEVLEYGAQAAAELAALQAGEERGRALAAEAEARAAALAESCAELSAVRAAAAERLMAELGAELAELGMAGARLQVELTQRADGAAQALEAPDGRRHSAGERGWDTAAFLWSANAGEAPQPLGRVASGGELARLLLALHALRAEGVDVPTLVFDEVDAGVGGRAAAAVAARLQLLGARRQVLCVTHLAVIAAAADRHFLIEKTAAGERTLTGVRALAGEQRTAEVARMLDGNRGALSREHASEMLRRLARPAG